MIKLKELSGPRSRQRALKELSELVHNHNGIPFFGTALGLIRKGTVLELDDDVDFAVPEIHKQELLKELRSMRELNFTFISDWLWAVTKRCEGEDVQIDFYFFSDEGEDIRFQWSFFGTPWLPQSHLLVPKSFRENFSYSEEDGFQVHSSGLAEYLYGDKWTVPLRKFVDYEVHLHRNRPVVYFPGRIRRYFREKIAVREGGQDLIGTLRRRLLLLLSLRLTDFMNLIRYHSENRRNEERLWENSSNEILRLQRLRNLD